jgi:hypothetical protein
MIAKLLLAILFARPFSEATFLSNSGCPCALVKGVATPNASATIAVGCSPKTDWTGSLTKWCLTDQTAPCGSFQAGFGWVDSCSSVALTSAIIPPSLVEWDQTPTTWYTGQTLNLTWSSTNILGDEFLKVAYQGTGSLRTLTTGSGLNVTAGGFSVRLSDATNMVTTATTPLLLTATSPTLSLNVTPINVLLSKIVYVNVYDNTTLVGTGNVNCDDRNLTIVWRGLGQAQFGLATVAIRSSGGGGGGGGTLVGSSVTVVASANMSISYLLPRTFTPSGFSTYSAQISVQQPGFSAYTLNSAGFRLITAPSPTPSPTISQTASKSVSASISYSASPSVSVTPTPSSTETARPSIDIAAINASAVASSQIYLAQILGPIGGIILLFCMGYAGYRYKERQALRSRRLRKLEAVKSRQTDRENVYGMNEAPVVMYQINTGSALNSYRSNRPKRNSGS